MAKRGQFTVPQDSWPKRLGDFGRSNPLRVRLRRPINGYRMVLPAGTCGTVTAGSMWDRLDFTAERCEHCGVQMRITTHVNDFVLIDAAGVALP
jgi:hypothetical protein